MFRTTSADGTSIAIDRIGEGPAVVMFGGFPTERTHHAGLAQLLAPHLTVVTYDRRGRGDTGNTEPYTLDREFEDLAAVINEAVDGIPMFYGTSGGAVLALKAAAHGIPVRRLALWEPIFVVDDSRPPFPADYRQQLEQLRDAGRHGDMVEMFFTTAVGMPVEWVKGMRDAPFWSAMEAVAPSLVHDSYVVDGTSVPAEWSTLNVPALALDGGSASAPWIRNGVAALVDVLPNVEHHTLDGQPHNVADDALAPALIKFLGS